MASGVGVNDECVKAFNEVKTGKKYRYVTFKMSEDLKEIIVENCVERSTWDEFKETLPHDDCRYAVFDFEYSLGEAGDRKEILLVSWCPETAKIKKKMLYASSKDALKKKFIGLSEREVQATDMSDLAYSDVLSKVKSKKVM